MQFFSFLSDLAALFAENQIQQTAKTKQNRTKQPNQTNKPTTKTETKPTNQSIHKTSSIIQLLNQ